MLQSKNPQSSIERMCRRISTYLPTGQPFHEQTYENILNATSRTLGERKNRKFPFTDYEIGHWFVRERLVSRLIAEGSLTLQHAKLFAEFFGPLHYNPPAEIEQAQLVALDKLTERLGEKKTNELLDRAAKLIKHDHMAYKKAELRLLPGHDIFANPLAKNPFMFWNSLKEIYSKKGKNALEYHREHLGPE